MRAMVMWLGLCLLAVEARSVEMKAMYERYCLPENLDEDAVMVELALLDEGSRTVLLDAARRQGEGEEGIMRRCAWFLLAAAKDQRVLTTLLDAVADTTRDPLERIFACENAWQFPAESVPTMLSLLVTPPKSEDSSEADSLRMRAIAALGKSGDEASRRRLRELLADPAYGSVFQFEIIKAIGRTRDATAVPQLLEMVASPLSEARKLAVAEALAAIGTRESVVPLVELVQRLPPGWDRYSTAMDMARALDRAAEQTQDANLRAELVRVAAAVRAVGFDLPGTKPPGS
jgi:HEAT repeat protein